MRFRVRLRARLRVGVRVVVRLRVGVSSACLAAVASTAFCQEEVRRVAEALLYTSVALASTRSYACCLAGSSSG